MFSEECRERMKFKIGSINKIFFSNGKISTLYFLETRSCAMKYLAKLTPFFQCQINTCCDQLDFVEIKNRKHDNDQLQAASRSR